MAVLVGGAAAAIHTDGAFMSADFDIVASNDEAFARAMAASGFIEDDKAPHGLTGWYHADHPRCQPSRFPVTTSTVVPISSDA